MLSLVVSRSIETAAETALCLVASHLSPQLSQETPNHTPSETCLKHMRYLPFIHVTREQSVVPVTRPMVDRGSICVVNLEHKRSRRRLVSGCKNLRAWLALLWIGTLVRLELQHYER